MMRRGGRTRPGWLTLVAAVVLLCVGVALAEKTCPQCGTQNADQAKFCKSCGAKLPEPPPSRPSPPRVSGTVSVSDGVVSITSEPSGASVIIDGRSRGTTPLSVSDLGTGRHEVTLSRDGYRDYNTTFTISGQVGTVVVTTEPVGAEVLVDGTSRGRAGDGGLALTRLSYGRHTVTVRMDGYQDVTKAIEVRAPGPVAVSFRLGWGKGYLRAESEPSGAELSTGGRSLGTTPFFVEMQPGRYVLTGTRRGHYDWSGFAEVQYAETALVRAIFERVTRPSPLLLGASVAALAGTGFCVLRGEAEYAAYRGATTADEAVRHRDATEKWDLFRNIGAGATVALGVSFALLRF